MINYAEIGKRIRVARKKRDLSQEQLAELVWISTTHMSHIETGNTKLSLPVLMRLSEVLQVGTDELLCTKHFQKSETISQEADALFRACSDSEAAFLLDLLYSAKDAMDRKL